MQKIKIAYNSTSIPAGYDPPTQPTCRRYRQGWPPTRESCSRLGGPVPVQRFALNAPTLPFPWCNVTRLGFTFPS